MGSAGRVGVARRAGRAAGSGEENRGETLRGWGAVQWPAIYFSVLKRRFQFLADYFF